jgi:hypothetical protein
MSSLGFEKDTHHYQEIWARRKQFSIVEPLNDKVKPLPELPFSLTSILISSTLKPAVRVRLSESGISDPHYLRHVASGLACSHLAVAESDEVTIGLLVLVSYQCILQTYRVLESLSQNQTTKRVVIGGMSNCIHFSIIVVSYPGEQMLQELTGNTSRSVVQFLLLQ